jgi:cytochrome c biogenesis protein
VHHTDPHASGKQVRPAEQRPVPQRSPVSGLLNLLLSMKFAIWIAVTLAVVSIAGVLVQQFLPGRDAPQAVLLRLPAPLVPIVAGLQLQDPFRAWWFRVLLGTLGLSLGLCAAKNFGPNFLQAFRVHVLREPRAIHLLPDHATIRHAPPELFDTVVRGLRRKLYFGIVSRGPTGRVAALHQGGISRLGPVLLHIGILGLVLGGLVSSLGGRKVFLFGSPGETIAIENSPYAMRIDDFRIDTNAVGQVKQYYSKLTVLREGREVTRQEIAVNHPLRVGGYNIYQASYQTDPDRAAALGIAVHPRAESDADTPHAGSAAGASGPVVQATMDTSFAVPGFIGYEFRVTRFFVDLKLTPDGPVNGSRELANPAAQLQVFYDGQPLTTQWAFQRFPAHAQPELPFVLELVDVRPALATGLEVNTNPGSPVVWSALVLSTLGLVLAFLVRHRTLYLIAQPAERGWSLWIGGSGGREPIAFSGEFQRFVRRVHQEARRLHDLGPREAASPPCADTSEVVVGSAGRS